jgi:16S rRNA (guanine966-N2)-methyltransferase
MFSAIEHLVDLDGAHVLDLYAGSGALGLEAASRGATRVVLVDSSKTVERVLTANIARIHESLGDAHTLLPVTSQALSYCQKVPLGQSFDLVLLDPPYDESPQSIVDCLNALEPALTTDSLVVVERAKKSPEPQWPPSFEVLKHKTYGDTAVFYLALRR